MNNENKLNLAASFLRDKFDTSLYFAEKPSSVREYRYEHSCRVAHIGKLIAEKEGLDVERETVACILHDVAYCQYFNGREDLVNHGRYSAHIARPFLESLGYSEPQVNEMCYAIAIHVDDKADFDGERNAFTLTVQDADNIDRFDVYRIHDTLNMVGYDDMSLDEKAEYAAKKIKRLAELRNIPFGTNTATEMWKEKIDFAAEYYARLQHQINISRIEK